MKNPDPSQDLDLSAFITHLRARRFDSSCCFLCAHHCDEKHLTLEHVIPKWSQRRFELWDQTLTLLNKTQLPYRLATVPCCEECNKYRLQPIEVSMSNAVTKGPLKVRQLGSNILFLWLGKIFYGILYRELSLLLDRSSNDGITIATPEMLQNYESHLLLLQQAREKVELIDFTPGSIFVFRCQTPKEVRMQWDFCDNIDTLFIGIRMGSVGIIGVLGDGGAQMVYEEAYKDIIDFPLHPLQFREVCAHFSYRSSITTRIPKYITVSGSPHKIHQMPLGGLSAKPYFEEWRTEVYGKHLSHFTGYPYEVVYQGQGKLMSWLHDDSGALRYLDYNEFPYNPL